MQQHALPATLRARIALAAGCLAFSGLGFFALAGVFLFAGRPARAAINCATKEECCVSNVTSECEAWLSHSGATGVLVSASCGELKFTLLGKHDATNLVKHTTSWTSLNPQQFTCDPDSVSFTTSAVPPTVEWVLTGPDDATNVWATGSGPIAISPSGAVSRVKCTFLLTDIAQGTNCPPSTFAVSGFSDGPCAPGDYVELTSPSPYAWTEDFYGEFGEFFLDLGTIGLEDLGIPFTYSPEPPKKSFYRLYLDKCCPNGVWGSLRKDSQKTDYIMYAAKTESRSLSELLPGNGVMEEIGEKQAWVVEQIQKLKDLIDQLEQLGGGGDALDQAKEKLARLEDLLSKWDDLVGAISAAVSNAEMALEAKKHERLWTTQEKDDCLGCHDLSECVTGYTRWQVRLRFKVDLLGDIGRWICGSEAKFGAEGCVWISHQEKHWRIGKTNWHEVSEGWFSVVTFYMDIPALGKPLKWSIPEEPEIIWVLPPTTSSNELCM